VAGEGLFVLVTADHLFGEGGLDRLLAAGEPAVLIDPAPDRPVWAEGTRVRVVDGAVVAFGKHLEEPAIDSGAFLLPPEVFGRQRQAASEGDHSLADAVTRLARPVPCGPLPCPPAAGGRTWTPPRGARQFRDGLRAKKRSPQTAAGSEHFRQRFLMRPVRSANLDSTRWPLSWE
jgi:hypothetical protein